MSGAGAGAGAGAGSGADRLAMLKSKGVVEGRESSDGRLRELESQVANLEGEREGLMEAIFALQKNIRSLVEERAAQYIDPRPKLKKAELKQVGKREAELSKKVSALESQLENLRKSGSIRAEAQEAQIAELKKMLDISEARAIHLDKLLELETKRSEALLPDYRAREADRIEAQDILAVTRRDLAAAEEKIKELERALSKSEEKLGIFYARRARVSRLKKEHLRRLLSIDFMHKKGQREMDSHLNLVGRVVRGLVDEKKSLISFIGQQAGLLAGYREQFSWMVPELNLMKSQLEALKTKVLSSDEYIAELAAMVEKLEAGRQRLYSFFNDLESQEKETASHAEGAAAGVVGSTDLEGLGQERVLGQRIAVATLFATAETVAVVVPPAGAESALSK